MEFARPTPEPSAATVARDRIRIRYAVAGAALLVAGLWVAWLGAWLAGWPMDELGIAPRRLEGLVGILTAPLAHASFDHLMSNTLPLGVLATLLLYGYPRAARLALPWIWIASGIGVWLFARDHSVHVGASGIVHGLMLFLFVIGLLRRDRFAVVTSLVVFFLYGGMLLSVLPHEERVSFEYHLAGALAGLFAAFAFRRRDPLPATRRYSWEVDTEARVDDELEPPVATDVPILWERASGESGNGRVVPFRPRRPIVAAAPGDEPR